MGSIFAAMFSGAMCALNVAFYAADPNPWSLGAAVFCGILTLINLAVAAMWS